MKSSALQSIEEQLSQLQQQLLNKQLLNKKKVIQIDNNAQASAEKPKVADSDYHVSKVEKQEQDQNHHLDGGASL